MTHFSTAQVLELLGGKWPNHSKYANFSYEAVEHWQVDYGVLAPYSGGAPMEGPTFTLRLLIPCWELFLP